MNCHAISGVRLAARSLLIQILSTHVNAWRLVCATLVLTFLNGMGTASAQAPTRDRQSSVLASTAVADGYGKVPLTFEPNLGQSDASVQFISHGPGYSLLLRSDEAVLSLHRRNAAARSEMGGSDGNSVDVLRMQLLGASTTAVVAGLDPQPGVTNYFIGNDSKKWRTGIPTYGKVNYTGVYPGIDLVFYGNQRQLEYDFVVKPGSDPSRIAWAFRGARPHLGEDGSLELCASGGPVRFLAPVAYQVIDGECRPVAASYAMGGETVRFALGSYDHSQALIIDPILSYFSYLGGTGNDYIGNSVNQGVGSPSPEPTQAVGIDAQGNLYVAGSTSSTIFPLLRLRSRRVRKAAGSTGRSCRSSTPTDRNCCIPHTLAAARAAATPLGRSRLIVPGTRTLRVRLRLTTSR